MVLSCSVGGAAEVVHSGTAIMWVSLLIILSARAKKKKIYIMKEQQSEMIRNAKKVEETIGSERMS